MTRTTTPPAPRTVPAFQVVAARQLRQPTSASTRGAYPGPMRHASATRSVVATTIASIVIAGCLYSGTELVLGLLGRSPLIAAPSDIVHFLNQVNLPPAMLVTVAALVVVAALALVLVAVRPGRLARREITSGRSVLGDAAAPREWAATEAAHLDTPDGVATVAHDEAARIDAASGTAPNRFTVAKAIAEAIAYDTLRPTLEPTVAVRSLSRARS